METQEEGGSASPRYGEGTEAQGPSVGHRPRLADEDRDGPGGKGRRGKGEHSLSDGRKGRKHRNHPRGDVSGASSSGSFTGNSKRATVPEITGLSCKRQVMPFTRVVSGTVACLREGP